jgi:pimeloyl-ACP methyl ester carboxylesterase
MFAWSWPSPTAWAIFAGVVFCAFWTYVCFHYYPIVERLIGQVPLLVPEPSRPLPGGEECEFRTGDGLTLRGTYLAHRNGERQGVILFGHELKGDRWNAVPFVTELLEAGFDVLTFDFRNHGTSDVDPQYVPRPWITTFDAADVRAAVNYLASRPDADPRGIGILAISRAGGATLAAVGGDPRVRCIFTDGAYPSHTTHLIYIRRYVEIYVPAGWHWLCRSLPDWFYSAFLERARRRWGRRHNYPFVHLEKEAARITQPTLMIHGGADTMIPAEAARALQQSIAGPSKLWVVSEAKHNEAINTEPDAYRRRLLKFFRLHLAPRRRERALSVR